MSVLIIAEHDNQQLKAATLSTIQAATELSSQNHLLIIGYQCAMVATQASNVVGIEKVICIDDSLYQHPLAENMAKVIHEIALRYDYILAPATSFGKNIMPRVSALFDVGQISDVVKIINKNTFVRPIYAGNALATIKSHDAKKILTIRTTAFTAAKLRENSAEIENKTLSIVSEASEFINLSQSDSSRPELTSAKIIISGGRGLQNKENFKLIEQLADKLNAAIGASRAAVDADFVPNDYQIGQTGKIVAPELYIAIGISGAIQHIAGMKDSQLIVAINKDPDAPIMQIADYALIGDLFEIIPELIEALG